jgi:hypothetical protein
MSDFYVIVIYIHFFINSPCRKIIIVEGIHCQKSKILVYIRVQGSVHSLSCPLVLKLCTIVNFFKSPTVLPTVAGGSIPSMRYERTLCAYWLLNFSASRDYMLNFFVYQPTCRTESLSGKGPRHSGQWSTHCMPKIVEFRPEYT